MANIYPTQFNGKESEKIPYEKFKNLKDKDLIIYYSRNYLYRNFYDTFSDGEIADFLVIHPNKGIIFIESKNGIISYDKNEGQWYQNEKTLKIDPIQQAISSGPLFPSYSFSHHRAGKAKRNAHTKEKARKERKQAKDNPTTTGTLQDTIL